MRKRESPFIGSLFMLLFFTLPLISGAGENPWKEDKNTITLWNLDEGNGGITCSQLNREHPGRLLGGVKWVKGDFGTGLEFDGNSGKVIIEGAPTEKIEPGQPFTLDVLVKPRPGKESGTMQVYQSAPALGLEIRGRENGEVWFNIDDAVSRTPILCRGKKNVCDDIWHRITVTKDPVRKKIYMYIDNELDGQVSYPDNAIFFVPGTISIGGEFSDTTVRRGEFFCGIIDRIHVSRAERTSPGPTTPTEKIDENKKPKLALEPLKRSAKTREVKQNEFVNSLGMKLVLIPAGEFSMGSGKDFNDGPVHRVSITSPYYMSVFETTQVQYRQIMNYNPSWFHYRSPDYPVECVSWFDAVEFCRKLSAKDGKTYRLPTEAEWEYACRAGSSATYFFADDPAGLEEYAWMAKNCGKPMEVGKKKPNSWGLYDMYGNVYEWVSDWYDEFYYKDCPAHDPAGPEKSGNQLGSGGKVARGGSFLPGSGLNALRTERCSSSARNCWIAYARHRGLGFRVVCEVDKTKNRR